ncbi:inositol phospholipid synthesis and fat-storage-inducing TM-domain-containing protein [Mycena rebaudengoi]|nr:inositol phospholipid synthesis and fat-storage-inducing TM-domain-containing protein [Mycena rebaudengoi]
MPTTRLAFVAVTAVVLLGTLYSVWKNTYLDTSNPLLTHLPHPLGTSHRWANKSNFLNVYFIKKAVGLDVCVLRAGMVATAIWVIFTAWFFGPALIERIVLASGGECILSLPSGELLALPAQYCHAHAAISPATHPTLFTSSFGHDVSGHIFLLTLSILLLAQQLAGSFALRRWSVPHAAAVNANIALILVWLFASGTTSVYFHSPLEKVTGYLLGVASFALVQVLATSTATHRFSDEQYYNESAREIDTNSHTD